MIHWKYAIFVMLIVLVGCDLPGGPRDRTNWEPLIACELAISTLESSTVDDVELVPRSQCDVCGGSGVVVQGDGHKTACSNCYDDQ